MLRPPFRRPVLPLLAALLGRSTGASGGLPSFEGPSDVPPEMVVVAPDRLTPLP